MTDTLREKFDNKTIRIGILMGGFSSEREISLKSGNAVCKALASLGYNAVPVDIKTPSAEGADSSNIDVAFIAMHGKFGEDGELQALLEARGIPYAGSGPQASRNAMDKIITKKLFIQAKISTADYFVMPLKTPLEKAKAFVESFGMPVVVKPRSEGSSVGITIVKDITELENALNICGQYQNEALVEKFIKGREVTVGILEDRALPLIELRPKREFYDYIAKYKDDKTEYIVNPDIAKEYQEEAKATALRAHRSLGCRHFSRVDVILREQDNKSFVLEVNSIPGMTERSLLPKAAQAMGLDFPHLCERLTGMSLPI
ncbi:MAG: D-alanine--D-alanine ligase [Planctomycetes bacterium]|nr:D-alanine--D-alanine ligase [Planctomycetota bacterium]